MKMRTVAALCVVVFASCVEPALPPSADAGAAADAGPYNCSPFTCTGCCSNNICRGGNEEEACGYDGRRCQACPSNTACLTPGTCVSIPSDAGSTGGDESYGGLTDPFTGGPLMPPTQKCTWVFGRRICS